MIRVDINPVRIERIVFESASEMERDFDDAAYRLIWPLLKLIDEQLTRAAAES
jgi:hypothetical protein